MSDPTRGITCPDMRRVVREAVKGGWQFAGWTGTTHARIIWPETGQVLTFGSTPSLASWKTLATDIKEASGVEVWRKGNRKRSRKAVEVSGFSPSATYSNPTQRTVDSLNTEWRQLTNQLAALEALGSSATRGQVAEALGIMRRRSAVEERLTDLHQPIPT